MADETTRNNTDEREQEIRAEEAEPEPASDERDDSGGDDDAADQEDVLERDAPVPRYTMVDLNRRLLGELVVHFRARDVRFVVDGDAAMRLLCLFAGGRDERLADVASPRTSSAYSVWLGIDLADVLAMSWVPGVPADHARATIDPVPQLAR